MEVIVSAEDDAEVRRVSIANAGSQPREIDVTSYAELVLGPQQDDVAHPAFMKLFVATEYLVEQGTILATRRRRTPNEPEIWAAHLAIVDGGTPGGSAVGRPQVATDRARFLGRGHGIRRAIAVLDGRPLSNSVGTVLDPIFALRRRVSVAPGATVRISFWTVVAGSARGGARPGRQTSRQRRVRAGGYAGVDPGAGAVASSRHRSGRGRALYQRLAGHLLYAGPTLRPSSDTILRGAGGQPGLWPMGISGDQPIVLLRIAEVENLDLARQLLQAHEYWRMKRLPVDVVILNERASSYVQDLQIALETLVRAGQSRPPVAEDRRPRPRLRAARRSE